MSTSTQGVNRRRFIQSGSVGSVAALTGPMLLSQNAIGANDTVRMGIIGPGRRGRQLMGDFSRLDNVKFVAISDPNESRLAQVADGTDWRMYTDFREMLDQPDIDAVIVATPDHWHALHSIYACMAEKDVYVEKPMTLTVVEGRRMVEAARKYDRVVQCGSQQRSDATSRTGCELVRNQALGKVKVVHGANYPSPWDQPMIGQSVPDDLDWDAWLGPAPWRPYHKDLYTPRARPGWISFVDFSGGEVTGWGAHGLDMIQWALGTDETGPVEISTEGNPRQLDRVVVMKYDNGVELRMDDKGPQGGGLFVCEHGSIRVDRGYYKADTDVDVDSVTIHEALEVSNNHQQNFIDCVRSRQRPICDVEIGHRSSTLCHLMNIARWAARPLMWDPETETFEGDPDANMYLDRPRRDPWQLPKL